jgi:hypothetical protein
MFKKWFGRKPAQAGTESPEYVDVYDFATRSVHRIPARELAPNMVQVQLEGVPGVVWVDARELNANSYQHPPFTEEIRDILRQIMASIGEVYPLSLEQWEDGFRRDANPEQEIALWLHVAEVYRRLTAGADLSQEQKTDYFRVLVGCMNSPREHVLQVVTLQEISKAEAISVIDAFFAGTS